MGHFGRRRPLWNLEEGEKGKGTNNSPNFHLKYMILTYKGFFMEKMSQIL
jgi:hypothetical protein